MAHRYDAYVEQEHTAFAGTGEYTDAGAAAPTARRTLVGAGMATGDTCIYTAVGRNGSGADVEGIEVGLGTKTATGLARTAIIASSNGAAAVNWATAAKVAVSITQLPGRVLGATPNANQNDYNAGGLAALVTARSLRLDIGATMKLTGLVATYDGHQVTIHNESSDYLLWLENENTASAAANRFRLPGGLPAFLMPDDCITLEYSGNDSRWKVVSWPSQGQGMGLTVFTDFQDGAGGLAATVNGTAAAVAASTYLVGTTERPVGAVQGTTGSTAAGRATVGHSSTDSIVPTLGAALSVARIAAQAANSGTETWQLISGFADSAGGTFTDGVAWNLRWNGSAAEWSQDRLANATATRSVVGSPAPDTNYIWLVVFLNAAWTRADFIYSTDSISFTKADSPTTGLPGNTRNTAWVAASLIKSAGTTARLFAADLAGMRMDSVRA